MNSWTNRWQRNNRGKIVQQWRRNKVEINSMNNNDDIYERQNNGTEPNVKWWNKIKQKDMEQ